MVIQSAKIANDRRPVVGNSNRVVGLGVVGIVTLVLSVKTGFRPIEVGTDYSRYYGHFELMREQGATLGHWEPGYELAAVLAGYSGASAETFFLLLAFGVFSLFLWGTWALLGLTFASDHRKREVCFLLVTALVLVWPFFWSGLTNAIRQGISISVLLPAYYALYLRRYWTFSALVLAATSFHWPGLVFGGAGLAWRFMGWRWMLALVIGTAACYGAGLTGLFFLHLERFTSVGIYSTVIDYGAGAGYRSGHRYDFLLFSIFPIVLWIWLWLLSSRAANDVRVLVGVYCALLLPFLIFGFGAYSNRWALPAWQFMPVLFGGMFVSVLRANLALASCVLIGFLCASAYAAWALPTGWGDIL